jgi:hypothetical protein
MGERRETGTKKEVWIDGAERLKKLIEYTKKIGLFHGIWTRTNHKELQREEYKWIRMLIKKERERKRRKEKWNVKIKTKMWFKFKFKWFPNWFFFSKDLQENHRSAVIYPPVFGKITLQVRHFSL